MQSNKAHILLPVGKWFIAEEPVPLPVYSILDTVISKERTWSIVCIEARDFIIWAPIPKALTVYNPSSKLAWSISMKLYYLHVGSSIVFVQVAYPSSAFSTPTPCALGVTDPLPIAFLKRWSQNSLAWQNEELLPPHSHRIQKIPSSHCQTGCFAKARDHSPRCYETHLSFILDSCTNGPTLQNRHHVPRQPDRTLLSTLVSRLLSLAQEHGPQGQWQERHPYYNF